MVRRWLKRFLSPGGFRIQLELPVERRQEPDRNFHVGGRSFYFFDFDDNVAFLTTPTFLFHKVDGRQIQISSRELAAHSGEIGLSGPYAHYEFRHDSTFGSFRHFRDKDLTWLQRFTGERQIFLKDLSSTLARPDLHWQGPSWSGFYHAVFNQRPVALITARGHHPETIKAGIRLWVKERHLPCEPNYLAVLPVSHPGIKAKLNLPDSVDIPELKQRAIRYSVEEAFRVYGNNPHHRFGMSDDDPRNIEWIAREMRQLKRRHPGVVFFIIQTHGEQIIKHEVLDDGLEDQVIEAGAAQLSLFDD